MDESLNKRKIGKAWENAAVSFLKDKGYSILCVNYRTRYSEIDIIAQDAHFLVFIEVKYRRNARSGNPLEAVDHKKQQRICRAAVSYMSENGYDMEKTFVRFDVIGIMGRRIEHIEGAF